MPTRKRIEQRLATTAPFRCFSGACLVSPRQEAKPTPKGPGLTVSMIHNTLKVDVFGRTEEHQANMHQMKQNCKEAKQDQIHLK